MWAMALAVGVTDGVIVKLGVVRFASRIPRNPVIIAILSAVAALVMAPAGTLRRMVVALPGTPGKLRLILAAAWAWSVHRVARAWRVLQERLPQCAPVLAAGLAVGIVTIAIAKGAFVAGGSDSYSYLSQAELWVHGTLRVEQPIMREVPWAHAFVPLGYTLTPDRSAIVPITAPGYPLVMAAFERIGGHRAVFYVVPLLGGLAVWATYVMGRRMAGRMVGLSSALLLATSPPFLFQLMFPMSDVPATSWWSLALALMLFDSRGAAFATGLSTGLAILTRPNLVPVAVAPGLFFLWSAVRERTLTGRAAERAWLFAAGMIPFCVAIAILNTFWYGSPLSNGYNTFDRLYGVQNVWPNLARYPRWLIDTETPIVLLMFVAPFLLPRRAGLDIRDTPRPLAMTWLLFIIAVFGCHVFLIPFDAWWYLRYLLPAFPAMCVLTTMAILSISTRLMRPVRDIATAAVILFLAARGLRYAADHAVFGFQEGERKYVSVGEYVARRLPERAIIMASVHGGSIRYYSGRMTVLWPAIPDTRLDVIIEQFRRLGLHPYLVVEQGEKADFRKRFQDGGDLAALAWPPIAQLRHRSAVEIYDLVDRQPVADGRHESTEIID